MIHLALIILALYVIVRMVGFLLALVVESFDDSPGCGCLSLFGVIFVILVIAVLAL